VTLLEHLIAVRDNAADEAERLLEQAGPEPTIGDLAVIESFLSDVDRSIRLIAFLESRQ